MLFLLQSAMLPLDQVGQTDIKQDSLSAKKFDCHFLKAET